MITMMMVTMIIIIMNELTDQSRGQASNLPLTFLQKERFDRETLNDPRSHTKLLEYFFFESFRMTSWIVLVRSNDNYRIGNRCLEYKLQSGSFPLVKARPGVATLNACFPVQTFPDCVSG